VRLRERAMVEATSHVMLPPPRHDGEVSLEHALQHRRSIREFARGAVTLAEIGQLLWAAQGVNHPMGLRIAPSAGALFPLVSYLVTGEVSSLPPGVYRYVPDRHALTMIGEGDRRPALSAAALGQSWIANAAAVLVLAAVYRRTTGKYGPTGERYVHIEIGHAAQNFYLQAFALGLGTTEVGAFDDDAVKTALALADDQDPLAIMPIGRIR
jgi:SagB-type dehydrogenase family enzyme